MPPNTTPASDGAQSRHAAYALVAQYLAATPPAGAEADARLWRAVDLALDATGLPPMTAPALSRPISVGDAAARLGHPPPARDDIGRWTPAPRPDELHGGRIGNDRGYDGEAPHWRNLVLEHGLEAARAVVLGRITAGGPITGLPDSYADHQAWTLEHGIDGIADRIGTPFTDDELALVADRGVPAYAVAAILCRLPNSVEKKRWRLREGRR
jgi:hypothetical protein